MLLCPLSNKVPKQNSNNLDGINHSLIYQRKCGNGEMPKITFNYTKHWNQLPHYVVDAPFVNSFNNRLDRHWKPYLDPDTDIFFDASISDPI